MKSWFEAMVSRLSLLLSFEECAACSAANRDLLAFFSAISVALGIEVLGTMGPNFEAMSRDWVPVVIRASLTPLLEFENMFVDCVAVVFEMTLLGDRVDCPERSAWREILEGPSFGTGICVSSSSSWYVEMRFLDFGRTTTGGSSEIGLESEEYVRETDLHRERR